MVSSSVSWTSWTASRIEIERSLRTCEAGRRAAAARRSWGSSALTRSTTSTVLASGWRWTAEDDRARAVVPARRLVVLDRVDHRGDVAQPHRRAVAGGDDEVAELAALAQLRAAPAMVSFCCVALNVPTGVLALAAAIAACISSTPMPRAASASGSSWTRTAYFWLPKICTCADAVDGRERRRDHLLGEGVELGSGVVSLRQRQEQDRRVGRVDLAVARRRRSSRPAAGAATRAIAACTSAAALSMSRSRSNWIAIEVEPCELGGADRVDAGDGRELLDQRRRHGVRHGVGRGAGQLGRDVDDREVDLRQRRHRQLRSRRRARRAPAPPTSGSSRPGGG